MLGLLNSQGTFTVEAAGQVAEEAFLAVGAYQASAAWEALVAQVEAMQFP